MTWHEVEERIRSGEDARTEFKRNARDFRAIGRALCAFANGDGGLLVLGVDDRGQVVGVEGDPEALQERLTSFLHNGCGKPVTAECGKQSIEGSWVHWVSVVRHQRGYEPFSCDGRLWIRRGRASVAPSPSELQELLNAFGLVMTERQVVPLAAVDHLMPGEFRSFMRRQGFDMDSTPQPARDDDLVNASVADFLDGTLRPTLYGIMMFGREPQAYPHTHNFFVQCTRYAGRDRSADVIGSGEGVGPLSDQVRACLRWFDSLGRREEYGDLYRKDIPLVPRNALREAVVNALIHRDYAITGSQVLLEVFYDRIVVTSPGALPNHMTVEQARGGGAPRSRNEMMANAMVVLGLMERRGRGWPSMRRAMREFNGTEPELEHDERNRLARVTFRFSAE